MSFYENQGSSNPVTDITQFVLTKENIPMYFKAGYYNDFDVSTDVSLLSSKKIVYKHHKCSNTQTDATYEDNTFSTSGAPTCPNVTTVNGQIVSTVKGGCYQTPYYKYSYTVNHPATYGKHDFYWKVTGPSSGETTCRYCGMVIGTGTESSWGGNTCKRSNAWTESASGYSTSRPSQGLQATYYLKSCGKSNGQLISADIFY